LAELPRRQREAVVLRYYLDFSIGETARVMRCTQGTVKSQVSKALASLREELHHPDQPTPAGQQ
jgi:RNA polymerase sigma factor (sigma-70 family)